MPAEPPLPPHNLDAERAVIGSCLRCSDLVGEVSLIVGPSDFYAYAHQILFAAIVRMDQERRPIDTITLTEEMAARKQVEDLGGFGYIAELLYAAPTGANVTHYAGIVREKSMLRQVAHCATEMLRTVYEDSADAEEVVHEAEARLFAIARAAVRCQPVPIAQAIAEAWDRIDARMNNPGASGVRTGYAMLDELTGGLKAGELTVIAARTSVGKTSLAVAIMRNYNLAGGAGAFFSLEQSRADLAERFLACETPINTHALRTGRIRPEEVRQLCEARDLLGRQRLWVIDDRRQNPARIGTNVRRLKTREGIGLVVIDYLQLVESEDRRLPRHEQVGTTMRRLREIAHEAELPVIVLAQLNRESESRNDPRPKLSDLRESGDIEQDSDVVLLLHNPLGVDGRRQSGTVQEVEVEVAKHRNGQTGSIILIHNRAMVRFEAGEKEGSAFPR
jgi:replicative DNA helicase